MQKSFSMNNVRIIDRYLLFRYLIPFGYCMAAFLLVMLIYDFSINLEDFIDGKVRLDIILEYFIYSLPMKIVEVIPMASLLSVLFSISNLKRHNEILALQASGISLSRLMVPYLAFGLFLSFFVLAINETLVPRCMQRVAKIETVYMKKKDEAKMGPTARVFAFYNLREDRSWVGVLDPGKKRLQRVEIREFDKQDRVLKKISAEFGYWTGDGWQLENGKVAEYGGQLGQEKARTFTIETFVLPETMKDLFDSQKDPAYMSLRELKTHINIHPKTSRVFHEEKVEYYHKMAYPLLNFLVMLMGVPIGMRSGKGSFILGVGTSIGLFIAYYVVNLVSLTLGKNEALPAFLGAWLPNILFGIFGLVLLRRTQ